MSEDKFPSNDVVDSLNSDLTKDNSMPHDINPMGIG